MDSMIRNERIIRDDDTYDDRQTASVSKSLVIELVKNLRRREDMQKKVGGGCTNTESPTFVH